MISAIKKIIVCFTILLALPLIAIPKVKALSLKIPPHAFEVTFNKVIPLDSLSVQQDERGRDTRLVGLDKTRVLKIYENSVQEDSNSVSIGHQSQVALSSSSDKILVCTYFSDSSRARTLKCASQLAGIVNGPVEIRSDFSELTERADKMFLFAYQNNTKPSEFEAILDQEGLESYKSYSSFVEDKNKRKIEDFQISANVNGKRFDIEASLNYDPKVLKFSEEERKERGYQTYTELIKFLFLTVAIIILLRGLYILFLKKKGDSSSNRVDGIIAILFSLVLFLIYFFLNLFFGIELL